MTREEARKAADNEFDWNRFTNGIAMKRLKQFHIIDVLKKQFPELK